MLDNIDLTEALSYAVQFLSFFVLSFAGAFITEIHNANTRDNYEFAAYKVVNGTITATLLSFAVREYYWDSTISHWAIMIFISFILGLIGYELFTHLSSIAGIKALIHTHNEINEELDNSKDENSNIEQKEIDIKKIKIHKH